MDLLVFPNQLFLKHPGLRLKPTRIVLIEDSLFFGDDRYPLGFHKQKLWLHRATMKRFESMLRDKGFRTVYLDYDPSTNSLHKQLAGLCKPKKSKPSQFVVAHPTDFILEKRLATNCERLGVELEYLPSPAFLNQSEQNLEYRSGQ